MPVLIKKNQVREVGVNDAIVYAWINNEMTITCLLQDQSKIGAHAVLFGTSGSELIQRMKKLIKGRTVTKVLVIGNGNYWGPELEDFITIVENAKDNWNKFTSQNDNPELSYENNIEQVKQLCIVYNVRKFKSWLKDQFKTTCIEFKNIERETFISVDKYGAPMKSNFHTAKL